MLYAVVVVDPAVVLHHVHFWPYVIVAALYGAGEIVTAAQKLWDRWKRKK